METPALANALSEPARRLRVVVIGPGGLGDALDRARELGSMEDAQALVRLADERGCILMVAFNRRYAPLYAEAHRRLAGQPLLIVAEKLRTHAADDLETAVIDDAIHRLTSCAGSEARWTW